MDEQAIQNPFSDDNCADHFNHREEVGDMSEEEEIIDEIIETDPDESQHHPIVDGYESSQKFYKNNDGGCYAHHDDQSYNKF